MHPHSPVPPFPTPDVMALVISTPEDELSEAYTDPTAMEPPIGFWGRHYLAVGIRNSFRT